MEMILSYLFKNNHPNESTPTTSTPSTSKKLAGESVEGGALSRYDLNARKRIISCGRGDYVVLHYTVK